MSISKIMNKLRKIASVLMLAVAVAFAAGCTKPDEPNNGGDDNGGGNNGGVDTIGSTEGPIHLPSVISENMDLQDLGYDVDYIIDYGCRIKDNALVTVGPSVTIQVEGPNSWGDVYGLYVLDNAGLKMTGTAAKPIRFVGHEGCGANERTWLGITVSSPSPENQWDYVEIHNAGVEEGEHPAVWLLCGNYGGNLAMRNCVIDGSNNTGLGLWHWGDFDPVLTEFKGNTIKNCAVAPIGVKGYNGLNCLVTGNTYSDNNTNNCVYIYSSSNRFNADVRFKKLEIPYCFSDYQEWYGDHKASIDPGVEMLFEKGGLEIFENVVLEAVGTEQDPIVFRPLNPQTTRWGGLRFSNASSGNVVSHCVLQDGGSSSNNSGYKGTNLLYIGKDTKLSLTGNIINNSRYYGVTISDIKTFDNVTRSGNSISSCELANVHIVYGGQYHGVTYSSDNGNMDLSDFPQ